VSLNPLPALVDWLVENETLLELVDRALFLVPKAIENMVSNWVILGWMSAEIMSSTIDVLSFVAGAALGAVVLWRCWGWWSLRHTAPSIGAGGIALVFTLGLWSAFSITAAIVGGTSLRQCASATMTEEELAEELSKYLPRPVGGPSRSPR
jgi:hypothetical protein